VRAEVAAKARPGGCSLWGADPLIDAIYPNGITTSYAYDSDSRLTNLSAVLNGTATITSFGYAYDAAGNRTSKQQLDYTEAYEYDPLYRLTGVERTGPLTGHWHYGYDPVGNRTSSQLDNAVTSAAYNEKNQLLSSSGGGPLRVRGVLDEPGTVKVNGQPASMLAGNTFEATVAATPGTNTFTAEATDASGNVNAKSFQVEVGGSGTSYSYDPNGNLTGRTEGTEPWTYSWNAENQLTKVEKNSAEQARFAYDPLGRRVEKVAAGVTTSYTYDRDDIVREVKGSTTLKYVHGPSSDEPLTADDGTAIAYLHADGLGSVVKITNGAGAVALTRQYDAWGSLEIGAGESGYAYTGREWDPETGLYYYRARYYDPKVARFASEDPLRLDSGINFYAYVENNPANWTDPTGEYSQIACILSYTAAGGMSGAAMGAMAGAAGGLAFAGVGAIPGGGGGAAAGSVWGGMAGAATGFALCPPDVPTYCAEHTKDARPSTKEKHEEAEARRNQDRGGERGDERRRPPRKRPPNWKGPWPPPPGTPWW
jgi:RHS repeat-associated protein